MANSIKQKQTKVKSVIKKRLSKKNQSSQGELKSEIQSELASENYKNCELQNNGRSHFVIHSTGSEMTIAGIKTLTKYDTPGRLKGKGHIYVMKDGSKLEIWSLKEELIWATKAESLDSGKLKGKMFHIELNYKSTGSPTEEQYKTLVNLYVEASKLVSCWPVIVPHIEVDRGLEGGHADPTNFDYNKFYGMLNEKGIPIDTIEKFDHNRYWGQESYRIPWATDKYNWPPILTGNPHK